VGVWVDFPSDGILIGIGYKALDIIWVGFLGGFLYI
jgi:hypothetical protein